MTQSQTTPNFQEPDELLDLVTKDDIVVGTVLRDTHHNDPASYTAQGLYFRGVAAWLINSKGEIWLPKRRPERKVAPNGYDFSMAEHVQSGEALVEAAIRGMMEELNVTVAENDLKDLGKLCREDVGALISVFAYKFNGEPNFSTNDYSGGQWLVPAQALTVVDSRLAKSGVKEGILLAEAFIQRGGFSEGSLE